MLIARSVIVTLMSTTGGGAVVWGRAELWAPNTSATAATAASAERRTCTADSLATACGSSTCTSHPARGRRGGRGPSLRVRFARGRRHVAAPERRSRGHARRNRIADRRRQRHTPPRSLAVPVHVEAELLRQLCLDSRRRPRPDLRAGPEEQSLRAR